MKRFLLVAFALAFSFSNFVLAEEFDDYPLIKTDLKSLKARRAKEFKLLRMVSSSEFEEMTPGHVDLLPFVSTKGIIRDQKKCGNCWVWTGLAAMEIIKNYYDEAREALEQNSFSVGFVNAFFNDGGRDGSFACSGGFFSDFVRFFSSKGPARQRIIPWSNQNAGFFDADGGKSYKGNLVSNKTKEEIEITPYYLVSNMSMMTLNLDAVTNEEAVNLIKDALNHGSPVALGFYMSGQNDWPEFKKFWSTGSDEEIFDIGERTSRYNQNYMSGHAVLIVGYDDTSANQNDHHFIALNSWGTPFGHPNGTFKLKMHQNYRSEICDGYSCDYKMELHIFYPVFTSKEPLIDKGNLSGKLIDPLGAGVKDVAVKLNNSETILTDANGLFSFNDVAAYSTYQLSFSRAGYKFTPKVYTDTITKASNYVEILVENDSAFNKCRGGEINLKSLGNIGNALFKLGKTAANKMPNKVTLLNSLNKIQKNYLNAFYAYPRVRFTCTPSCRKESHAAYKLKLRNSINKLANTAQNNWQKCLNKKKASANVVETKKKTIKLKKTLANKQLQNLPASGEICD